MFAVHVAVNFTVPLFVSVKFLKYVFFVAVPVHAVLGFAAVPVFAFSPNPSAVLDFHPANVYPVLVGLLICISVSYVPLVGLFVPFVPPA